MKYRKLPVIIDAMQYTGTKESVNELKEFMPDDKYYFHHATGFPVIKTLEGDHNVSINDYVIKGVAGEFYPCKPEIFEKTYVSADCNDMKICPMSFFTSLDTFENCKLYECSWWMNYGGGGCAITAIADNLYSFGGIRE